MRFKIEIRYDCHDQVNITGYRLHKHNLNYNMNRANYSGTCWYQCCCVKMCHIRAISSNPNPDVYYIFHHLLQRWLCVQIPGWSLQKLSPFEWFDLHSAKMFCFRTLKINVPCNIMNECTLVERHRNAFLC